MTARAPLCRAVAFVDDDADMRRANRQSLELADYDALVFENAAEALARIDADFPGIVVSDLRMPGIDGMQLFRTLQERDPDLPLILITGHGDVATAVAAIRDGVYDFITKPYAPDALLRSIGRALEQRTLTLENRRLRREAERAAASSVLIGVSPEIEKLRRTIDQIAAADVEILIEGETGTGKTLVATLLHRAGRRRARPMATLDCGALPETMIDSELFGHVPGAFPGAQHSRVGRIEAAEFGTLFLDEIDSLPLAIQPKLLRAIEDRVIVPVGSNDTRAIDVRIIAASAADLRQRARDGRFLDALLYRLNAVVLRLPPLRERREDIPLLFDHFLRDAALRLKRDAPAITSEHWATLTSHDWPGNIRELIHYAERAVLGIGTPGLEPPAEAAPLAERVAHFEAAQLRHALALNEGNIGATIASLGLPRKTFYDKLKRHRIDPRIWRRSDPR